MILGAISGWKEILSPGWVGAILTLGTGGIGFVLALVLYRLSLPRAALAYQWGGKRLVGKRDGALPKGLVVTYQGVAVERLTATTIVMWNAGRTTLRGDQVVGGDPLRVILPTGTKILNVDIVKRSRTFNDVKFLAPDVDASAVPCAFDYLDPGDGVRVDVLHDASSPEPQVLGTLRGLPDGIVNRGPLAPRNRDYAMFFRRLKLYTLAAGFVTFHFLWQLSSWIRDGTLRSHKSELLGNGIIALAFVALPAVTYWVFRRRHPVTLEDDFPMAVARPDPYAS